MKNFKGFTLAEVMITLAVIGIITAIVMPIMVNSAPDKNVMKFKKADTTLKKVIRELANSGEYYEEGDLGKFKDGTYASDEQNSQLCETFSDLVSTKRKVCKYSTNAVSHMIYCGFTDGNWYTTKCNENYTEENWNKAFDTHCKNAQTNNTGKDLGILTTDNIYYYESNIINPFGCFIESEENGCTYTNSEWNGTINGKRLYNEKYSDIVLLSSGITTHRRYKVFCIDIDEIGKGEDPFGYGIRVDGKIVVGKRANEWLQKDFNGKDPSEQEE